MTAGIRIRNDDSMLVIDDTFFNYAFISKHTLTFAAGTSSGLWTGGSAPSAVLSLSGLDRPVAAARGSKGWVLAAIGKVGANWVFHFSGGLHGSTATSGDTIEVFVFDRPKAATTGYGLRIWDGNGNIVFESNRKYMRVIDVRSITGNFPDTQLLPGTHAQIVMVNTHSKSIVPLTPTNGQWVINAGFVWTVSGGFVGHRINYAEGSYNPQMPPPFPAPEQVQGMQIMSVDVAGY